MDIVIDGWHLSNREELLLIAAALMGATFVTGMIGAWIGAWWGGRRSARRAVRDALERGIAAPAQETEARMAHLAHAVDAMAVEVERISEAQRFLVKLMSEREAARLPVPASLPATPPAPPVGSVTPH